jgi:hypothetical protein
MRFKFQMPPPHLQQNIFGRIFLNNKSRSWFQRSLFSGRSSTSRRDVMLVAVALAPPASGNDVIGRKVRSRNDRNARRVGNIWILVHWARLTTARPQSSLSSRERLANEISGLMRTSTNIVAFGLVTDLSAIQGRKVYGLCWRRRLAAFLEDDVKFSVHLRVLLVSCEGAMLNCTSDE